MSKAKLFGICSDVTVYHVRFKTGETSIVHMFWTCPSLGIFLEGDFQNFVPYS